MALIGRCYPGCDSTVKVALKSEADTQERLVSRAFRKAPQSAKADLFA